MKTIKMCAKCSDLFTANLTQDGKQVGEDYNGYVPDFFPGQHYGDYVILDIEIDTGRIRNWKKPTAAQLKATFKA